MKYRLLGKSGLRVSEAALGTMTFGEEWGWGSPKAEAQKVYETYREAGGNFFAVRQHDLLPFNTGRNRHGFGADRFDVSRNLGPDAVDQRVVHDAVLLARRLVEEIAESRDPVLAVMRGLSQRRFGDSGFAKAVDLQLSAEFFDAKVGRIHRVRVDQGRGDAGASEHRGSGRAGKPTADDRNVGISQGGPRLFEAPSLPRERQINL